MHRPCRRWARLVPHLALVAVAYVPLLLTEQGQVVADTKTYLYLDPSRLLSRAWSMWDPSQAFGTVTHQNIGYLWPMGPWYWAFDKLGVPDWTAQRLWLGTIILLAALGTRWLLHVLGWRDPAPWAAAFAYAFTPYVLSVAARISVLLLPFAALPWLVGLTVRALREGGWRWPALFALTVTSAGSVNLTALVLVGVGPLLWIAYALATKEVRLRPALAAVARIGVLTVPVCLWWLAGLWVQGGWGLDVLRYSETAKVVALASTANEVLRGLGYWFFYGSDKLGPWIEPSVTYTQRLAVLALSYSIPVVALIGFAITRFRHRAFAVLLVVAGVTLAVGAHPWDDRTIVGRGIEAILQSDKGLALRSLPRAAPLVALGLAIGIGALVGAIGRNVPRRAWPATAAVMAICVVNLAPLWQLQMVPANLKRPEDVPAYWDQLAAYLDGRGSSTRVLELPGSDFASYRWGNTVDPVLPGLMDRPSAARELVPFGTPASADLLIALDHRLQERTLDPQALAPIARLMSAGDIAVRSDLQYERYNTPRPRNLWALLSQARGLAAPVGFGAPAPNVASPVAPLYDELYLQTPATLADPPPVAAFGVDGAPSIVRVQPSAAPVVVAGDGEGIVDAAEAGLIDGRELLLYAASDVAGIAARTPAGAALLVTDSNRRRGRRWTTVRHNTGETTPAGQQPLRTDPTDNDLPLFPAAGDDSKTVVEPSGGIRAQATSYGNPITFTPEERAAGAVDGDPATAWRTGAFAKAVGERLALTLDQPITTDHLTVLQPQTGEINRSITKVRLRFDDGTSVDEDLDASSLQGEGQRLSFPARRIGRVDIEILADTAGSPPRYDGLTSVGFAEVRIGDASPRMEEVIRPPVDLLGALGEGSLAHPLTFLFTRQRSTATDPTRADEELALRRAIELPADRSFTLTGTARLDAGASDATLDALLGVSGPALMASAPRLPGDLGARASAAIDGDPATAWTGRFDRGTGAWLEYRTDAPSSASSLTLTVRADGAHSVPTELRVVADGIDLGPLPVPAISDGRALGDVRTVTVSLPRQVTASDWRVEVAAIRPVETKSWNSGNPTQFPVSIAELGLAGLRSSSPGPVFSSGCRNDLVTVDGAPLPVQVAGDTAAATTGGGLRLSACGGSPLSLTAGRHVLRSAKGTDVGIAVDQAALRSAAGGAPAPAEGLLAPAPPAGATIEVTGDAPDRVTAQVRGATAGTPLWVVLGQSFSPGWRATIDGGGSQAPQLVDGYANGWLVTPAASTFSVSLRFVPQQTVDKALAVSAIAAIVCLALALWPRTRRRVRCDEPELSLVGRPSGLDVAHGLGPGVRAGAALVTGAAAGALAGPGVGAAIAVATFVATLGPRARLGVRLAAPAVLATAAAYVIVQQARHHIAPGLEWPSELERAHPLGWLAALLLVADLVGGRLSRPRGATAGGRAAADQR